MMTMTPTDFRKNLFNILDKLLESGEVLEINRNGQIFKLIPPKKQSKFDKLLWRDNVYNGTNDELINNNWGDLWKPFI